jgi:hypothetical protein
MSREWPGEPVARTFTRARESVCLVPQGVACVLSIRFILTSILCTSGFASSLPNHLVVPCRRCIYSHQSIDHETLNPITSSHSIWHDTDLPAIGAATRPATSDTLDTACGGGGGTWTIMCETERISQTHCRSTWGNEIGATDLPVNSPPCVCVRERARARARMRVRACVRACVTQLTIGLASHEPDKPTAPRGMAV